MCFKNLPIEFDEQGKAYLKKGVANPYEYSEQRLKDNVTSYQQKSMENLGSPRGNPGNPGVVAEKRTTREFNIDPVTRVAGALGFHTAIDLKERKVVEANSSATLFRGYEVIMRGRDPRDAIDITSRACGVCGAVHANCSSLALEMAFPVKPPPLGVVVRNLGWSAEFLYDHPLHLFLLAGPDYSESIVKATNPEVWEKAAKTDAPQSNIHGFKTIGDIMVAMNPLTGSLYLEAFEITRLARELCSLMYGKYPHPSTLVPGGVSTTITFTSFNEYYTRLVKLFDYSKKVVTLWDDLTDFFYDVNPDYKKVGSRPVNMIGLGAFDDPDYYDATYKNADTWGEKRLVTPGVVINGELRTTKLSQINIGVEEFVEHSFYDTWGGKVLKTDEGKVVKLDDGQVMKTDPLGQPLSPNHPWNKWTIPEPTGRNWHEKYSWATSPRWDRTVLEAGCYVRIWNTALAKKYETDYIKPTGKGLKMLVPRAVLPEMEFEWKIPNTLNALERNRGRAYCLPWMCIIAFHNFLKAMDLWKKGETKTHTKFDVPQKGRQIGVGFWEAGRGYLSHHVTIENGKILNYQIITPSTWNASPKDPLGQPGPYEQAVLNTPLLETSPPDKFQGIDIQRAIRSFDPCMPCTTHMYIGDRVLTREVNSCTCSLEDMTEEVVQE